MVTGEIDRAGATRLGAHGWLAALRTIWLVVPAAALLLARRHAVREDAPA